MCVCPEAGGAVHEPPDLPIPSERGRRWSVQQPDLTPPQCVHEGLVKGPVRKDDPFFPIQLVLGVI